MNETVGSADASRRPGQAEQETALFAHLLIQQTNMAMMLLGKIPHPDTGKTLTDIDSARFFIDTVEMLEAKTKGNLTSEESRLLKQALMNLRMSFVEAVESAAPAEGPQPEGRATAPAQSAPAPEKPSEPAAGEEEHKKKFSKKY